MKSASRTIALIVLALCSVNLNLRALCAETVSDGEALYNAKKYLDAEFMFMRILSKEPRNFTAYYLLGNCFLQRGYALEAKEHYQFVMDNDPNSTVAEYCKIALQNASFQRGAAAPTPNGGGGLSVGPAPAGRQAIGNPTSAPPGTTVFFGGTRSAQFDDDSKNLAQAQALGAECDAKVQEMDRDTAGRVARLQQDSKDSMVSFSNGKYSYGAQANAYNQPVKREFDDKIKRENEQNSKAKREIQEVCASRMRSLGGRINF